MEVFSVISSDKNLIEKLVDRFLCDKSIKRIGQDHDTIYFNFNSDGTSAFYLHIENDFEEEAKFNFDIEQEKFIKQFFKNEEIFMLDISYKDSTLLYQLLSDFAKDLKISYNEKLIPLLFDDPFQRFVKIEGIGSAPGLPPRLS